MSKTAGLVDKVAGALRSVGLKAPWKLTGPVSSPEYLSHLPKAVDYRPHGPASAPYKPSVPQAEPERVYDIKYYTRDSRREMLPGGTKQLTRMHVDARGNAEESVEPVTPGQPHQFSSPRSILDADNNGYTL